MAAEDPARLARCYLVAVVDCPFELKENFKEVFAQKQNKGKWDLALPAAMRSKAKPVHEPVMMLDINVDNVTLRHANGGTEALAVPWDVISRWQASRGTLIISVMPAKDRGTAFKVVLSPLGETAAAVSGAMQRLAYALFEAKRESGANGPEREGNRGEADGAPPTPPQNDNAPSLSRSLSSGPVERDATAGLEELGEKVPAVVPRLAPPPVVRPRRVTAPELDLAANSDVGLSPRAHAQASGDSGSAGLTLSPLAGLMHNALDAALALAPEGPAGARARARSQAAPPADGLFASGVGASPPAPPPALNLLA